MHFTSRDKFEENLILSHNSEKVTLFLKELKGFFYSRKIYFIPVEFKEMMLVPGL